jgi:SsrA-binding protein
MYFKSGTVKLELALARGRKLYDVRRVVAEREAAREARREIANAMKRSARYS